MVGISKLEHGLNEPALGESMLTGPAEIRRDGASAASDTQSPLAGRVILVADDDPVLAGTLKMIFTASGAEEVLLASDGVQARGILNEQGHRIDGLVLDLRMPNEDGVSLLRSASELAFRGKLIVLSGENPEVIKGAERLAHLFGLNCVGAFRKPINPMELIGHFAEDVATRAATVHPLENNRVLQLDHVLYQPRIDVMTGQSIGAEALSRFSDQDGRPVGPDIAIAQAEANGTIDDLTWRIVDQVLHDAALADAALPTMINFSINVSAESISKSGFVDEFCGRILESGLDLCDFTVELTETRLATDAVAALENLTRLRLQDVGVALDDFGTGHANVEQLGAYPFTALKIDKQFVIAAQTDRFAASCVETAVRLAKSVGMKTVAEGVETQWASDFVRNLLVDEAQGFLFSKPIEFDALVDFASH